MKNIVLIILALNILVACNSSTNQVENSDNNDELVVDSNRFADLRILNYDASGINDLRDRKSVV